MSPGDPHVSPPVHDRASSSSTWRWRVVAIVVGITSMAPINFAVGVGLDISWGIALHLATNERMAFGRDVQFTFGPLGFLVSTVTVLPLQSVLAALARVPVAISVAWFFVTRLRRVLRGCVGAVATVVLAFVFGWVVNGTLSSGAALANVPLLVAGAVGCERLAAGRVAHRPWLDALFGFLAALLLLVKFDVGVVALALSAVWAAAGSVPAIDDAASPHQPSPSTIAVSLVRRVGLVGGGALVGTVVPWVLLGQPLGTLLAFLRYSWDVTLGFGPAMTQEVHQSWASPALLLATVGTAAVVVLGVVGRRGRPSIAALAFAGVFIGTTALQGFGRYDGGHALRYTAMLMLLAVGFGCSGERPALARHIISVLTILLVMLVGLGLASPLDAAFGHVTHQPFMDPRTGWRTLDKTLRFAASPSTHNAFVDSEHARLAPEINMPESVRGVARGRTVHIDPWETAVAWIYGMRWKPLPVFQTYSAYTHALDDLNASALRSNRRAPEVILTQNIAIDGRVARFTSPDTQFEMICRYTRRAGEGGWTAFLRAPTNRCGRAAQVASGRARAGKAVDLRPFLRADRLLVVRFDGVEGRGLLIRKTPPTIHLTADGLKTTFHHRFIAATGPGRHVMALPSCLRSQFGAGDGYDVTNYASFSLTGLGSGSYGYTIESIPFTCAR